MFFITLHAVLIHTKKMNANKDIIIMFMSVQCYSFKHLVDEGKQQVSIDKVIKRRGRTEDMMRTKTKQTCCSKTEQAGLPTTEDNKSNMEIKPN